MRQTLIDIALTILFVLLQTTIAQYLAVAGLAPDIALIWIVYLSLRRGQITGTVAGFFTGLVLDLLSGSDGMLGLAALSKTAGGFMAGYFFNENKTIQTLGSYRFILIILSVSLVHNLIYFIIFLQGSGAHWWQAILLYGIPAALYTAAVGLIPTFVFARRALL
ncbi:MAG TPA: rod shape-determining protein MreD [Bacteroidota bacterium]|jgi:rod shape-determining protein MreD